MPSFDVTVEFEVFCERCGAGICNNVKTRVSRSRCTNQITVEPCERCIETAENDAEYKARHEASKELEDKICNLEQEIEELKQKINEQQT